MIKCRQVEQNKKPSCLKAFEVFGDEWTLRIIDSLRNGELRFKEIQNSLEINSATLSTKLKSMEERSLIERNEETIDKLSVTYSLTKLGKEIIPILDTMFKFGSKLVK
jgi:DNA-binding HxlR family transcriptional regulator